MMKAKREDKKKKKNDDWEPWDEQKDDCVDVDNRRQTLRILHVGAIAEWTVYVIRMITGEL